MELKIEYSNDSLTSEKLEALVVFVVEDSDLSGSGLRSLPGDLKKNLNASIKLKVLQVRKTKVSICFLVMQKSRKF